MEKKYTNIKERVLHFAKSQGVSIQFFLTKIDMTYGSFKGKAKEGALNSDAIAKILTLYPQINSEWLLIGKGEMLKQDVGLSVASEPETTPNEVAMVKDEMIAMLKKDVEELRNDKQLLQDLVKAKYLGE